MRVSVFSESVCIYKINCTHWTQKKTVQNIEIMKLLYSFDVKNKYAFCDRLKYS